MVTTARGRHQLKIVVAIDVAFADEVKGSPHVPETHDLRRHYQFVRQCVEMYGANIIRDFEPFAIMEFGSVVLAFDSMSNIRKILNETGRKTDLQSQSRPIFPRFSCHVAEIPTEQPILESTVVRRAVEMMNLAKLGEMVVSRTVFDMLSKLQANLVQLNHDTFVMGGRNDQNLVGLDSAEAEQEYRPEDETTNLTSAEHSSSEDTGSTVEDLTIVGPQILPSQNPLAVMSSSAEAAIAAISAGEEAVLAGNNQLCYRALARINRLIDDSEGIDDVALGACRADIERALHFSETAVYVLRKRPYIFHIKSAIEIGRRTTARLDDIHVGCQLVSKFGRQTRIEYRDEQFHVSDQGSTNGTFLNQNQVSPDNWEPIKHGARIHMGGGSHPPRPGLCVLACNRIVGDRPALVMEFLTNRMAPVDREKIVPHWRTMDLDGEYRWILAPTGLLIGPSARCAIKAPADESDIAAQITFKNGYFIKPTENTELLIGGEAFATEVILADNTEISINGTIIQFYSSTTFFRDRLLQPIND